jgi:hypothetical protein
MFKLGELRASPQRLRELADANVLIAAATDAEVVLRGPPKRPESTMVFQHETIAIMRAERAHEVEKLRQQLTPKSVVIPIRKLPGSFWDQITIGRAPTNDMVLGDPAVSNVHAHFELNIDGEPVSLQDLSSSNGTFVNRKPLQPHVLTPLRAGDCLRFGQSVFYFVTPSMLADLLK